MRPELRFETERMRGADLGEPCSVPDVLGEHILQNDLEFLLDEDDEIYEGYGRRKNAYPYRQYNCYTRELKEKEANRNKSTARKKEEVQEEDEVFDEAVLEEEEEEEEENE